jgi:hypothetical protein
MGKGALAHEIDDNGEIAPPPTALRLQLRRQIPK